MSRHVRNDRETGQPVTYIRIGYNTASHEVGRWYWSGYWGYAYKVLAVDGYRVTVVNLVGRTWEHSTPLQHNDGFVSLIDGQNPEGAGERCGA